MTPVGGKSSVAQFHWNQDFNTQYLNLTKIHEFL